MTKELQPNIIIQFYQGPNLRIGRVKHSFVDSFGERYYRVQAAPIEKWETPEDCVFYVVETQIIRARGKD